MNNISTQVQQRGAYFTAGFQDDIDVAECALD